MKFVNLLLLSLSLSADAFSVSLCKGLKLKRELVKNAVVTGLFFGCFQAVMPVIGYFLGIRFVSYIEKYDHFIVFGLLLIIGAKMIIDVIRGKDDDVSDKMNLKELLFLAVATSIDALAVGVTFAFDQTVSIWISAAVIGFITFAVCVAGVFLGHSFGTKFGKASSILGGVILILIGTKILLEGIGVL